MDGWSLRARAVILDLDGVLADSNAAVEGAWREWADRCDLEPSDVLPLVWGTRTEDVMRRLAPHRDAAAEITWLEHRESQYTIAACPGAVEFVRALAPARWGIVTSGWRDTATSRLEKIGIPIPEILITASDTFRGKPDPEPYRAAWRALGTAAGDCVVIEDSAAGVRAARASGARIIGISGAPLTGTDVDVRVNSLREVRVEVNAADVILSSWKHPH
jgi:mannitol-1-/sugar-/sorbitol-6-phosphatase